MIETTHRYRDDRVILRFDENEKDWRKNGRTEYWTGREWKRGVTNAKIYWHEDDANQALVSLRIQRRNLSTN